MKANRFLLPIVVLFVAYTTVHSVDASALDIATDSPFCADSEAKNPQLKDLVIPDWRKEAAAPLTVGELEKIRAKNPELRKARISDLDDIDDLAHILNAGYLESIRESLYVRLTSAAEIRIDIRKYQPALDQMAIRCNSADISMHAYKKHSAPLQAMVGEVLTDYSQMRLSPAGEDSTIRKLAIAALEAQRIQSVIKFLVAKYKAAPTPDVKKLISDSLDENERRLIRLHFAFPALGDLETSSVSQHLTESLVSDRIGIRASKAIFWTHPQVESQLGLNPPGVVTRSLGAIPFAPKVDPSLSTFYAQLYEGILSGHEILYGDIRRVLVGAIDRSVSAAIQSASMKCANPTPCGALAVNPTLAANWITNLGKTKTLGPLACACQIGAGRETVPAKLNLGLGFAAAGSVIAALLQPEVSPLIYAAWTLSIADMGAAGAGVYDGLDSYYRMRQMIDARSGGATGEKQRERTNIEDSRASFGMVYDVGTGIVGLMPPAKMSMAYAGVPLRAVVRDGEFLKGSSLELVKGATGAAPPDLTSDSYSDSWDPSRLEVPLPPQAATLYPALWRNLQSAAGKGIFARVPGTRDRVVNDLKQAAKAMMASGAASDLALIKRGEVRADLCLTPEAKTLSFVK